MHTFWLSLIRGCIQSILQLGSHLLWPVTEAVAVPAAVAAAQARLESLHGQERPQQQQQRGRADALLSRCRTRTVPPSGCTLDLAERVQLWQMQLHWDWDCLPVAASVCVLFSLISSLYPRSQCSLGSRFQCLRSTYGTGTALFWIRPVRRQTDRGIGVAR